MIYTIVGNENIIKFETDKIIKNEINTTIKTYEIEYINKALEDINTLNMFEEKKIIIINNLKKIEFEENLINYIENPSNNIMILTTTEKLDERKKLTKKLRDKTNIIETQKIDLISYIKNELKDYKIDFKALNLIISFSASNYEKIKSEIEKLKMYKLQEKEITEEDIKKITKKSLNETVFDLIKMLNVNNKKEIFDIYYNLKQEGEDEAKLVATLATNYRLMLKIKVLQNTKTEQEIIKIFKLHPYRYKMLNIEIKKYTKERLKLILKGLSDLDISVKTGKVTKEIGLELFFSKI